MRIGFVERFREAFDHESNAAIARRLNSTDATIKQWTDGNRFPLAEMLLEITRATGINIHWLLTGQGPKRISREVEVFSEIEQAKIRAAAKLAGRTYEEQVRVLTLAAIDLAQAVH